MVAVLVDAHRVRAGHRIPINVQDCDLSSLARQTVDDLRASHGDRFVLDADPVVRGMWSADQLRRTIWNLAMNGINFGTDGAPLIVSVKNGDDGAELAVHNDGPALSEGDRQELFRPFSLPRAGSGDPPGWGLGLTLVWGCAEAHGGRVDVASTPGKGTTVKLVIPYDSRPYAE
jgi:signal transduction histidine kinase